MQLLDTSYIVRYVTNDVPTLAQRAAGVIESQEALGLSPLVLLEAWHVLRNAPYDIPHVAVVEAFIRLSLRKNMRGVGVHLDYLVVALNRCLGQPRVDVGDALLTASALSAGILEVYTFDRRFARTGMIRVEESIDEK